MSSVQRDFNPNVIDEVSRNDNDGPGLWASKTYYHPSLHSGLFVVPVEFHELFGIMPVPMSNQKQVDSL